MKQTDLLIIEQTRQAARLRQQVVFTVYDGSELKFVNADAFRAAERVYIVAIGFPERRAVFARKQ